MTTSRSFATANVSLDSLPPEHSAEAGCIVQAGGQAEATRERNHVLRGYRCSRRVGADFSGDVRIVRAGDEQRLNSQVAYF